MREFADLNGKSWTASVATARRPDYPDYKGRFHFVMTPQDGGGEVALVDVRWNSDRTAERTLETMSVVELRRRLRSALGRQAEAVAL